MPPVPRAIKVRPIKGAHLFVYDTKYTSEQYAIVVVADVIVVVVIVDAIVVVVIFVVAVLFVLCRPDTLSIIKKERDGDEGRGVVGERKAGNEGRGSESGIIIKGKDR